MRTSSAILLVLCAYCSASCSTPNTVASAASVSRAPDDLQQRQISAFERAVNAPDTLASLREMPVAGWSLKNPQYLNALKHCKPSYELQASRANEGHFWRQWECDANSEFVKRDFQEATVGTRYIFKKQWLVEINIDLTYPILIGGHNG